MRLDLGNSPEMIAGEVMRTMARLSPRVYADGTEFAVAQMVRASRAAGADKHSMLNSIFVTLKEFELSSLEAAYDHGHRILEEMRFDG